MARVNRDSKLWEDAHKASRAVNVKQYKKPVAKVVKSKPGEVILVELAKVNKQIKLLKERKKHLNAQLRSLDLQKPARLAYSKRPIILYALRLEDGCFYVGMTRDVQKRYKAHGTRKGAAWTRTHHPIEIIETRTTGLIDDSQAALLEDDMTIEYALKYGSALVRGGGYCQSKPRWPDLIIQNEMYL